MKKYISAILIPCLLLQFTGCYSSREITLEELKYFNDSNDILLKTKQEEFLIYRNSERYNFMDWVINDSSITVKTKEYTTENNYIYSIDKNTEIKLEDIENVEIDEFNVITTSILLTVIVGFIVLLGVASSAAVAVSGN